MNVLICFQFKLLLCYLDCYEVKLINSFRNLTLSPRHHPISQGTSRHIFASFAEVILFILWDVNTI